MSSTELGDHFKFFDLDTYATIDDLDENYHHMSLELHKLKSTDPAHVQKTQQQYDNVYYTLLQHFIREDCKEGQDRRTWDFGYHDISTRRHESGVRRRLFRDEETVTMRQKTASELFNLAKEDADTVPGEENDGQNSKNKEEDNEDIEEAAVTIRRRQSDPRTPTRQHIRNKIFEIHETTGNIFDAPDDSVIVHAVNCQGVWGSGFAAELKIKYPNAYAEYVHWCQTFESRDSLAGFCLLIRPQQANYLVEGGRRPRHWIACLFTSVGYGQPDPTKLNPGKDGVETILLNTDSALVDLRNDLCKEVAAALLRRPPDLFSPQINAGSFGVPWEQTKQLIAMCFAGYPGNWTVFQPPVDRI